MLLSAVSKRFWLPTQKGTQAFPNTIQAPTKLVINGVEPGTPEFAAVAAHFDGRLKQFHGKCQQEYSLSDNPIMKRRVDLGPDGRATYTNIHGHETLHLEVSAGIKKKIEEAKVDYWDFALIEIVVPDMHYTNGALDLKGAAHLTTPNEAPLQTGMTWPVNGLAVNFEARSTADKMINAPQAADFVNSSTVIDQSCVASFAVDLRPAHGISAVTVDLHALIDTRIETFPSHQWITPNGFGVTTTNSYAPLSSYTQLAGDQPNADPIYTLTQTTNGGVLPEITNIDSGGNVSGWPDYTGTVHRVGQSGTLGGPRTGWVFYSNLPDITYDLSQGWVFVATGGKFYNEFLGNTSEGFSGGVYVVDTSHSWWRQWYISGGPDGYIAGYSGPNPIPAQIQLTLFKGEPSLESGKYVSSYDTFYRWDYKNLFPGRVGHMNLADIDIQTYTNNSPFVSDPGGVFGIPKLGTVVISLRTDRGVSFNKV